MVHFVGAGSGAADLITVRGARLLGEADVVIYAGSLVNPALLSYTKPGCEIHNSAKMTLEEVIAVIRAAEAAGKTTVRLHTGDSSIYGAVREQFDELEALGIAYDVCPGVSAFCGAAAALKAEYTLPDVSQTVIITRAAGRTPVPARESIRALAAHRATMVLFLSTSLTEQLQEDLLAGVYGEAFANMDALIFVGACGVAVRSIAPFVRDKKTDPAVLCLDERASFVIPLLSGHIGGANALAARLASALGAKAVITTATDVNGKFAVDAWAAQNGCAIEDFALAKRFAAEILEHDLPLCSEFPVCPPLPGGVFAAEEGPFGVYIGCRTESPFGVTLRLIPRKLRVGLGCRRGTEQAAIEAAVRQVFRENRLALAAISGVSSIDLKQDEPGLLAACRANGWQARFYSAAQLRAVPGSFTGSRFVASVTGVDNVCERAALYGGGRLLVQKQALGGVTVAVAEEPWEVRFG